MSRVRFHFAEGETLELLGMERHYLGHLTSEIAFGAVGFSANNRPQQQIKVIEEQFKPFITQSGWGDNRPQDQIVSDFAMYLNHAMRDDFLSWRGKPIASFALLLNTAIVFGSDPIKLAAKIHGTCEIHGYVEGKDRSWFADVIDEGLDNGIYRRTYRAAKNPVSELLLLTGKKDQIAQEDLVMIDHSMGWTEIVKQLRSSDQGEVVMSYSVTDGFPDPPVDWVTPGEPVEDEDEEFDRRWEAWHDLPDEERFRLAVTELREKGRNRPISPESIKTLFRHELTLMDLYSGNIAKIEKSLGL